MNKQLRWVCIVWAVCLLMSGSWALAGESITVVSFGGAYAKSQIEAHHKPFAAQSGVTVNSEDYNGGIGEIRAQVESGNVVWDVVDVEKQDMVAACDEGLLEPIDWSKLPTAPDGTPATEDFVPGALHECGVGTIVWTTIIAYDRTKFPGEKPSTLADFFDLKKFPGMRSLNKRPIVALEFALMADGVPNEKVYEVLSTPEGVDRAFAKLDTIKDSMIWWEAGAQPPQLLADGEAVMVSAYNGRIFNAVANESKPFEIIWDHHVYSMDYYVIPKGGKNQKAALEFVHFASGTQALADQTRYISYGPVRKSSGPLITTLAGTDIQMAGHMPTAPDNFKTALASSFEWWADNQDEMNERFNTWIAK